MSQRRICSRRKLAASSAHRKCKDATLVLGISVSKLSQDSSVPKRTSGILTLYKRPRIPACEKNNARNGAVEWFFKSGDLSYGCGGLAPVHQ